MILLQPLFGGERKIAQIEQTSPLDVPPYADESVLNKFTFLLQRLPALFIIKKIHPSLVL